MKILRTIDLNHHRLNIQSLPQSLKNQPGKVRRLQHYLIEALCFQERICEHAGALLLPYNLFMVADIGPSASWAELQQHIG